MAAVKANHLGKQNFWRKNNVIWAKIVYRKIEIINGIINALVYTKNIATTPAAMVIKHIVLVLEK